MLNRSEFIEGPERALLESVVRDLEVALSHLEEHNLGIARTWISVAISKLPKESDVHRLPWPTYDEYRLDTKFDFSPEYESVRNP